MKKIIMTLAALLCCAMTTTVFTSCGDDDDDNSNTQKPDNSLVAVQMNYVIETTQATLNIAAVTVEYYDADGQIQSEALTGEKMAEEHTAQTACHSRHSPESSTEGRLRRG